MTPEEARGVHEGDHVYLLAPQEKARLLDRFFADLPPPSSPDPHLLGDFFVGGEATLGGLAEIYGLSVEPDQTAMTVSELFAKRRGGNPYAGDIVRVGTLRWSRIACATTGSSPSACSLPSRSPSRCQRLWEKLRRLSVPELERPARDRHRTVAEIHHHSLHPEHLSESLHGQRFTRPCVGHDASLRHHHHAVGEARREREIMDHRHQRAACVRRLSQQLHHHN